MNNRNLYLCCVTFPFQGTNKQVPISCRKESTLPPDKDTLSFPHQEEILFVIWSVDNGTNPNEGKFILGNTKEMEG